MSEMVPISGHRRGRFGRISIAGAILLALAFVSPDAFAASRSNDAGTPTVNCDDSWIGGDGMWSTAADWSNGTPMEGSNVCITAPGTYTVTAEGADYGVNSLTVGGTTGTQTLDITSTGKTETDVVVNSDSAIESTGAIIVDATTANGFPASLGGAAGTTLTNDGTLTTDGADEVALGTSLVNDADGTVTLDSPNTVTGSFDVTNSGSLSVGSGDTYQMDGTVFTQTAGTIDNGGTISNSGGGSEFNQNGGSDIGNPIDLEGFVTFDDGVGAGQFVLSGLNSIFGTVPSDQTVTSMSTPTVETETSLAAPGLTNKGKLVITSSGTNPDTCDLASTAASLTNDGALDLTGATAAVDEIGTPFTNETDGIIDIDSPQSQINNESGINAGHLIVTAGASLVLNGSTLKDTSRAATAVTANADGALSDITGGTEKLAGRLLVTTIGQPKVGRIYTPIAATALSGKFASLSSGTSIYELSYSAKAATLQVSFDASAKNIHARQKKSAKFVVATLTGATNGLRATIQWGDSTSGSGRVSFNGDKGTVTGTHRYLKPGKRNVTVVLTENGVTKTVIGKATVSK